MHLRRALLLFAIVLGLAAVAASVSRPRDTDESPGQETVTEAEQPPTASPGAPAAVELTLFAAEPEPQRIRAGQAATLFVEVEEPGQVAIPDLGMSATAEPLTPARFDVLTRQTGRHPIEFEPAGADDARVRLGTLVVVEGGVRRAAVLLLAAVAGGCSDDEPVPAPDPPPPQRPVAAPLEPARCPAGLSNCRTASGRIVYVERVDPDGDGDAHFVLSSRQSITLPGLSVIDVEKSLRPHPLPVRGDRISAAGPVYRGSYGQKQIEALELHVARAR